MPPERKFPILYSSRTNTNTQESFYHFAIFNKDKLEMKKIWSKMRKVMPFTVKIETDIEGKINSVNYRILEINTYNKTISISDMIKEYGGEIVMDIKLYNRESGQGALENYVCGEIEKLVKKLF